MKLKEYGWNVENIFFLKTFFLLTALGILQAIELLHCLVQVLLQF